MFYRLRRRLRLLLPGINVELMYGHSLEQIPKEVASIEIRIELLTKENIHRILEVRKLDIPRMIMRLERGDLCYVGITRDNLVVSYHWVQKSGKHFIQQAGRHVRIKKGEIWIYHVRVADSFRGNRINGAVYTKILEDAKNEGEQYAWIYTNKKNYSNRKGLERLGFQIKSEIYSLEINGKFHQLYKKDS